MAHSSLDRSSGGGGGGGGGGIIVLLLCVVVCCFCTIVIVELWGSGWNTVPNNYLNLPGIP